MFVRTCLAFTAMLVGSIGLRAQSPATAADTPRIWQGVYTAAQADRGKAAYETACLRCHGVDLTGTTAPALTGARFYTTWGGGALEALYAKIRDTMPPNFGGQLDDRGKLDIVGYILQTNGYPAGPGELASAGADLADAVILRKGEQASVQNFALVQTVGCLATGPNGTWLLTRTADPVVTRDERPSERSLASASARPLGSRTYRLISAAPFQPQSHAGQKMEARGLIYTEPGDERLNLTSLQPTGGCE